MQTQILLSRAQHGPIFHVSHPTSSDKQGTYAIRRLSIGLILKMGLWTRVGGLIPSQWSLVIV